MTELLDAVDDLTRPKPVKVATDTGYTWATEDPLLDQLADAVASGLGSPSGGTAAPWARNLLNTDALHTAGMITSQIADWCRMVKVPTTRNTAIDLRSWYDAFSASAGESLDDFYVRKLRAWGEQIRGMLNPPKLLQVTAACPECLESSYPNEDGALVPYPVVIQYWANGVSVWDGAKASCRACGFEWRGEWDLRSLRHSVDEMDANPANS
jgi:hypothetical protein